MWSQEKNFSSCFLTVQFFFLSFPQYLKRHFPSKFSFPFPPSLSSLPNKALVHTRTSATTAAAVSSVLLVSNYKNAAILSDTVLTIMNSNIIRASSSTLGMQYDYISSDTFQLRINKADLDHKQTIAPKRLFI